MNASTPSVPPRINEPQALPDLPHLIRRFLVCNPFYLISAACLLYGLYRLTLEPSIHRAELGQLATIFGSLQIYEVLVVATAIFLARRLIWYDSTLLVMMENMLVLVPFILVTLAAFEGATVAWVVCGSGALMAALKFSSLKRLIPVLNLPSRLLAIGAVVLVANLGFPFFFRAVHEADSAPLAGYSRLGWLLVLPALLALVNMLKRPVQCGEVAAQRSWLPIGFATIWITVSAVHLYCIGYIYDLQWQLALLAPLLWVASWTLYNRLGDFSAYPRPIWDTALLIPPAVAMLLAAVNGVNQIIFGLAVLNTLMYGRLYLQDRDNRPVFHLALLSLTTLLATLPANIAQVLIPEFTRERCIGAALVSYVILRSLLSANPLLALSGATGITMATNEIIYPGSGTFSIALQLGFVFTLIHSIFWQQERHHYGDQLRCLVALAWVWHSWAWMHDAGALAGWATAGFAGLVVTSYLVVRVVWYYWASRIIPAAAVLVIVWMPVKTIPIGFVPVLIAFALFGLGTLIALRRDKWLRLQ